MKEILLEILTVLCRIEIKLNDINKNLNKEDEKKILLND
tara:strand:- start:6381 stop:6497 length:117 start_codon:yes stop_codon:yes gene_type:complete